MFGDFTAQPDEVLLRTQVRMNAQVCRLELRRPRALKMNDKPLPTIARFFETENGRVSREQYFTFNSEQEAQRDWLRLQSDPLLDRAYLYASQVIEATPSRAVSLS